MQADLESRVAKARETSGRKGGEGRLNCMVAPRDGAGQVVMVEPPNTGKSPILRTLTRVTPAAGNCLFTKPEQIPASMPVDDIAFQLVDLPSRSEQHTGAWVFETMGRMRAASARVPLGGSIQPP